MYASCGLHFYRHQRSSLRTKTVKTKLSNATSRCLSESRKREVRLTGLYQFYLEGAGLDAMAADYQTAALANPNNYYPHFALGQAYATLRRYEDAIAALTQARLNTQLNRSLPRLMT